MCVVPGAFTRRTCDDLCTRLFELLPSLEHVFVQPRSALAFVGLGLRGGAYVGADRECCRGCALVANGLQFSWAPDTEVAQLPSIEVQALGLQLIAVECEEQKKSDKPAVSGARWARQQVWVGDAEVWTGMAAASALAGFRNACLDRGFLGPSKEEQLARLGL